MDKLKAWFIPVYLPLTLVAIVHSAIALLSGGGLLWLTVLLANLPIVVFMGWLSQSGAARTSQNLPGMWLPAVIFGLLSILAVGTREDYSGWLIPLYGAVLGAGGSLLYVFWYSRLGRRMDIPLTVGAPMPEVEFEDEHGGTVATRDLAGQPTVYMFYRGNWCPLCMAQIKEVAERNQQLQAMGAQVVLISPQSHEHTRELAARFQVDFRFLVDPDCRVAKQLDIFHENGLPKGMDRMLGLDKDTVMPTVVITDASNRIIFADLTDNYRVRPDPDVFLKILSNNNPVVDV